MSEELDRALKTAYRGTAGSWAEGPSRVYGPLAEALVDRSPVPIRGARVLDLGAGTGVVSEAVRRRGGEAVALDLTWDMLVHRRELRPPAVVADLRAIPLRRGAFDVAAAAYCFNHLADPASGLREAARVVRPGGAVLASGFPDNRDHPAKAVIEDVLDRFGYERPDWYVRFREQAVGHPTTDAGRFAAAAEAAGLVDVDVADVDVDCGVDAEGIVDWRLGMAQFLPFVSGLDLDTGARLRAEAVSEVGAASPMVPALLLAARVP